MTEKGPDKATLWQLIKDLPASKLVAVERFLTYLQNKDAKQILRALAGESAPYDTDFYRWTQTQAAALRDEELKWLEGLDLDLDNLAEEIESLGHRDRRAIESYLESIMKHWLKWIHQPHERERRSHGWLVSIGNARAGIEKLQEESPSLREINPARLPMIYRRAREGASRETRLPLSTFPDT
jgi:hypothetical protein